MPPGSRLDMASHGFRRGTLKGLPGAGQIKPSSWRLQAPGHGQGNEAPWHGCHGQGVSGLLNWAPFREAATVSWFNWHGQPPGFALPGLYISPGGRWEAR
ncbi:MAG: hypothetical protein LBU69_02960 [Deltaproteobacteria bacterium]|nr:hypothetical protein [Deltaproteobacteria bacterium]